MLTREDARRFFFLPDFHDMRCKAPRVLEIVRCRYHMNPRCGAVYVFMSRDRKRVRMIHYENHAYYVHEKHFTQGYRFMKISFRDGKPVYAVEWRDLVALLEMPVMKQITLA